MTVSFQLFSGPAELKPIGAHAPILSTAPNICTVLLVSGEFSTEMYPAFHSEPRRSPRSAVRAVTIYV